MLIYWPYWLLRFKIVSKNGTLANKKPWKFHKYFKFSPKPHTRRCNWIWFLKVLSIDFNLVYFTWPPCVRFLRYWPFFKKRILYKITQNCNIQITLSNLYFPACVYWCTVCVYQCQSSWLKLQEYSCSGERINTALGGDGSTLLKNLLCNWAFQAILQHFNASLFWR